MPMSPKGNIHVLLAAKYNGVDSLGSETEMIRILQDAKWYHSPLIRNVFTKIFQSVENPSLNEITNTVVEELRTRASINLDVDLVMQAGNLGTSTIQVYGHEITSKLGAF